MKKMLFWVLLCAPSLLFCQSETKNQPIKTKIDVFKEGTGVPIEMTIEEIGKVKAI